MASLKQFFKKLGPGIITGASDDDPSGIATYSVAGAQSGYSLLWSALFTFPLMAAIQEMCARIGLVTGRGLAGNMRSHYPKYLLYLIAALVITANTINIGADISGMAESAHLIIPIAPQYLALVITLLVIFLLIKLPYKKIAASLKWLTFALFAYILAALVTQQDWLVIAKNTIIPKLDFDKNSISLLVAILGTTISPYLFFWQTSEEVEELKETGQIAKTRKLQIVTKHELKGMREDVTFGMFFSNLVMFAIIATTASTLFVKGQQEIQTAAQAASALEPIAGPFASLLFVIGIVGTGLLAIPILAGAAAYAVAEIFAWREGFDKSFHQAKSFYLVIIISTILGFLINLSGINPFKLLFYTAFIYGLISPILILVILHLSNKAEVMGKNKNGVVSNLLGVITFLIMLAAAVSFFLVG